MIDDKKIEEAALSYCAKCSDITNRNVNLDKDGCVDLHNGFIDGAKWAINEFLKNLWHPNTKEPDKNKSDIIVTPLGNFCDWEKYCKAVKNNELVRRNNHIDDDKIVH